MQRTADGGARTPVEVATVADAELVAAMARLIPQLGPEARAPDGKQLAAIIASPAISLLVARDARRGGAIVGTLTLVAYQTPTAKRAWIDDVVVDVVARGRGVGEALTREALRLAESMGAASVALTSHPVREAANRLYRRLGFRLRDTNLYRLVLTDDAPSS